MVATLAAWPWSEDHREWRSRPTCHGHVVWEKYRDFYSCKTASNNLKCSYGFKSVLDPHAWVILLITSPASRPATCWYLTTGCLFSMLFCVICHTASNSLCHPCCLYCTYLTRPSSVTCYCWIQRSSSLWEPGLPKPYSCIYPLSIWPTPVFSLHQFLWNQ